MGLCKLCQEISRRKWRVESREYFGEWIEHHESYSSLCKSVAEGCNLCNLLRHGLLDRFGNNAEALQLEGDNKEDGAKFWIIQRHSYPECVEGILCERALLTGFYYRRYSSDPAAQEHHIAMDLGPFFKLTAPSDISPKSLLGRSRGLRPCFADARKWLHQCMADHVECSQQIHDAPTRLLYIHSSQVEDCVRLIEPPRSAKMRYAALSHCWGQLQPLRTTKMTFEIHKQGIRLGDLPQTFQDAVVVAKELDIEYLWIDSLCIIQDSVQDWERECSKMSSVYSGAWVTIAASDAADSSQGFLHNYVSSKFDSWNFTYSNGREDALVTVSVTYKPEDLENHLSEPKPRLSERGWALQERLLSQRILSFRTNRMSWECSKLCYSDDMHYPYTMEHLSYDMVDKRSIRSLSDLSTAFEYWYETVMTYTKCQLTKNTDKLPALSGLAQAFSDVLGDTYVAGLWKNDIHVGLTWYNWRAYSQSECNEENPPSYRAPSWSWACSDVGIHFRTEIRNQPKDLIIVSVGVNPKGLDPFGEVSHGTLCVNGRVKEGGLGLGNSVKNRQPKLYNLDDTNTVIAAVHLDNHQLITKIIRESSQQKETLGLLVSYDDLAYTTWVGLVLENIGVSGGKRVFRRIGIILCNENYVAGYNWFHGCKRESLEIV